MATARKIRTDRKAATPAPKATSPAKTKAAPKAAKTKAATKSKVAVRTVHPLISPPSAGALLKAHTAAVLRVFGLTKQGTKVPRTVLNKVWGPTAVGYHHKKGNMVTEEGQVSTTANGVKFFSARTVDDKLVAQYEAALKDGKTSELVKSGNIGTALTY